MKCSGAAFASGRSRRPGFIRRASHEPMRWVISREATMNLISEGPTSCQFSMHMVLFFAKLPWSSFANLTFLNQQMASVWAIISWCLAMADSRGGMGLVRVGSPDANTQNARWSYRHFLIGVGDNEGSWEGVLGKTLPGRGRLLIREPDRPREGKGNRNQEQLQSRD